MIILCGLCQDTGQTISGDFCSDCCEHIETDHGICIDCGADCLDRLIERIDFND
jgi:predicted amidophosphoribosyltransferase